MTTQKLFVDGEPRPALPLLHLGLLCRRHNQPPVEELLVRTGTVAESAMPAVLSAEKDIQNEDIARDANEAIKRIGKVSLPIVAEAIENTGTSDAEATLPLESVAACS